MAAVIKALDGYLPEVAASAFLADGAVLVGHVVVRDRACIWYNAVLRADMAPIEVGQGSSIGDLTSLFSTRAHPPLRIGPQVSIGRSTVVTGASIDEGALVGHGCIIMGGARVGARAVVAAGSLVPAGAVVPPGTLVRGRPAQVVRDLSDEELRLGATTAAGAGRLSEKHRASG